MFMHTFSNQSLFIIVNYTDKKFIVSTVGITLNNYSFYIPPLNKIFPISLLVPAIDLHRLRLLPTDNYL